jgi:hypothetical protein
MFLDLPDPDPLFRGMDPDPDPFFILLSSGKNSKINHGSYCFVTSFGLILKNYVNVPSKSNKQEIFFKKISFVGVLKVSDENKQDPDPLVRDMDPRIRIWIHTKMSWIRTTGLRIQKIC